MQPIHFSDPDAFNVLQPVRKFALGAVLAFCGALLAAVQADPPAGWDDLLAKLPGWIVIGITAALGGGGLNGARNVVKHRRKLQSGPTGGPPRFGFVWLPLLLIPAALVSGCATFDDARLRDELRAWDTARVAARQAVGAYQDGAPVEPYPTGGQVEDALRRQAFREGVFVFGEAFLAARGAAPDLGYIGWMQSGVQVAVWWTGLRYPGLSRGWLDLVLESRAELRVASLLLPDDLEQQLIGLLAFLDSLESGPLPDAASPVMRRALALPDTAGNIR